MVGHEDSENFPRMLELALEAWRRDDLNLAGLFVRGAEVALLLHGLEDRFLSEATPEEALSLIAPDWSAELAAWDEPEFVATVKERYGDEEGQAFLDGMRRAIQARRGGTLSDGPDQSEGTQS